MKIKRALLSVSDKTGIVELGKFLSNNGVEIISTGGTMKALREAGVPVTYVSDVTGFPEIMDGRVKTLNPNSSQKRCRHTKAFIIRMRRNDSDPVFFIKN